MDRERDLLRLFDLALIVKAIDGSFEVLAAVAAILVSPAFVKRIADFATAGELAQDPFDFVAHAIRDAAHIFSVSNHLLVALYLALHGLTKILLVAGIFAGKRIAYPLFIAALGIFGAYEAYRGVARGELLLQILAAFDLMLLILTAYEYRRRYPATPRPDSAR